MTVRVIKLSSVSQKWYAKTLDMKMFEKQFAAQHTDNVFLGLYWLNKVHCGLFSLN